MMKKIRRHSKKGLTLVELIVAMTLTAIFMASCVILILPVEKIYTQVNEESRAQILADTVVNSLRAECSNASVLGADDVQILTTGASGPVSEDVDALYGNVLKFRRTNSYYETISANYTVTNDHRTAVLNADEDPQVNSTTSRSVYRMNFTSDPSSSDSTTCGHLHYGYFNTDSGSAVPYDFTNPLVAGAYGDFLVSVSFDSIECGSDTIPDYVNCTVTVYDRNDEVVYSRSTVLCF
jgi:prepilin-type N-terminal cleavage/methylation domain-containing protein